MAIGTGTIRVVIGKVGCDIHERGALVLARAFRDAGMEVIYLGRYQTPEAVARTAIDEDADVIALSDHTGSMRYIVADVVKALEKMEGTHIPIVAGGLIPKSDLKYLEKLGVTGNYGPGTPLEVIIGHIQGLVKRRKK
jgi:methylmalonyl-CoA mutase C-terminal domain/subunit